MSERTILHAYLVGMKILHGMYVIVLGLTFMAGISACKPVIVHGYANTISCFPGDSLTLYIHARESRKAYPMCFTDLEEKVYTHFSTNLFPQTIQTDEPYANGFAYQPTTTVKVPDVKSGIYRFALSIPVVVKSRSTPEIVVVYSSNTDEAYNNAGGKSLYNYNSSGEQRASRVSFQRPLDLPLHSAAFLKEFEGLRDSVEVGYVADKDLDDFACLDGVKVLVVPGHSEYWTRKARENFDRFVASGGNALILSGNTMWWQVRYSRDGNQLICYKGYDDPVNDSTLMTINWTKPELDFPVMQSIGSDFNSGGFGRKEDRGWDGFKIVNADSPLLRGSGLKNGEILRIPSDEYDGAPLQFNVDSSEVELLNPYGFFRYELIAYDFASRLPGSNGAWIAMQRTADSGMIINVGSTDWCSEAGIHGKDGDKVIAITRHMLQALRSGKPDAVFTKN